MGDFHGRTVSFRGCKPSLSTRMETASWGGGFVDPSQDADLFGSWMFSDDMARAQTLVHKLILGSLVFLSNIVNNLRFL